LSKQKLSGIMFDRRDHGLLTIVNDVLNRDKRQEYNKRKFYPHFHPHGIKKLAESRGLRIAYAVIHLLESLEAGKQDERIGALRALRDEVLNASDGTMPKNTARALLQIMKELVRSQGDYNRQLQLAHDFRVTATGKPRMVRKQLRCYHLLEMPEEWNQLAFDDHVHDVNTKGRKSATHLIMDAWIKGIRRLRVVYYNYIQAPSAAELLEAAEIMGITLRIGIEYAARFRGRYVQLIWVPRGFIDTQAFLCFLTEAPVRNLMEEGRRVSEYRQQQVLEVLDAFNRRHLPVINETYGISLKPIDPAAFLTFVKPGQTSLLHLAKYIHTQLLPELKKKLTDLRIQYDSADPQAQTLIDTLVEDMNRLDFDNILDRFLNPAQNPDLPDPQIVQDGPDVPSLLRLSPRDMLLRLVQLHIGYRITLNLTDLRPEDVLEIIYDCEGLITRLETFNLKDYTGGKTALVPEISRLQVAINEGNVITLKRIILSIMEQTAASSSPDKSNRLEKLEAILHDINTLRLMYKGTPLKSRIGSDSTGMSPRMHGMGMAVMETLPGRALREVFQPNTERMIIPFRMTAYRRVTYVPRKGFTPLVNRFFSRAKSIPGINWLIHEHHLDWLAMEHTTRMESPGNIVTLGGIHEDAGNNLYLCPPQVTQETIRLSWPYLNTLAKIIIKMMIGFIPAFLAFALRYDWWVLKFGGAFIWFGITGVRNILQSVLGGGGLRSSPLLGWKDYISWERIGDSLLYTGFSVPLLDWVIKTLILERTFEITTTTNPSELYAIMALSNGLYLSCHNAFRGFPKTVIAGNFFRSILSIPVAIVFNGVIATLLSAAGISGIEDVLQKWAAVISKSASDFVAGVIEGAADRYRNIHLRLRDYRDKLTQILEVYTSLELLFPDKKVMETLSDMNKSLSGDAKELELIMIIHALDLLFFWNYQPRGRTALIMLAKSLSPEECRILLGSLHILKKQREISMLFIDGIIGKNFSSGLAFYLNSAGQYLGDVQKILGDPVEQKELSNQEALR
jgi:hypothetical protein